MTPWMVTLGSKRNQSYSNGKPSADHIEPPQDLNIAVPFLGKIVLTWKHSKAPENKTIIYHVNISTPEKTDIYKTRDNVSSRSMLELYRGLRASVAAQVIDDNPIISQWVSAELPPYPGIEGTSATNVSCQIDLVASGYSSLGCTWVPGGRAPADTEYHLYYRKDYVTRRCQDYSAEPGGRRRVGCRVSLGEMSSERILIHINGTSHSRKIRATEKIYNSMDIEMIPPVQNLKLDQTGLHWSKPINTMNDICFTYHINIWSQSKNDTFTVRSCSFSSDLLLNPSDRQFIRVRAEGLPSCWDHYPCSPWSDIIHIGGDGDRANILVIIVSVCLMVASIITFLMCIRFWRKIFPQIPKPKKDLKQAFQNVQNQALMRHNSWENEEVISYIEELVAPDKYKTSADYGHIADYSSLRL
ncbi:interleukin-5 receptor subunit alpha isoform X2 [Engystomops pustulosus]|uniref:interleukin-5 receptor subunit alpha isoform X2 n=1 Tax=Engystomops pustulosus TaxID=76066 RepID=UPI003AFA75EB